MWVVRTVVTQVTEYQSKSPISIHANLLFSVYIKVVIPNVLFQLSLISCYCPSGQVSFKIPTSLNCLCSIFPGPLSRLPHVSGNVHIIPVYMALSHLCIWIFSFSRDLEKIWERHSYPYLVDIMHDPIFSNQAINRFDNQ